MCASPIEWLGDNPEEFPPHYKALKDPNGLLAAGGDLSPERLLAAYRQGIFPWYEENQPILWWSPDPRAVLFPADIHISHSLRKVFRRRNFSISYNTAFASVMRGCAEPRSGQWGTWITTDMMRAYEQLHRMGYAHSIEVWQQKELVGGLYGVAVGKAFFAESMFHHVNNASKVALATLAVQLDKWRFNLIDCQLPTAHLASMGGRQLSRVRFLALLEKACGKQAVSEAFQ